MVALAVRRASQSWMTAVVLAGTILLWQIGVASLHIPEVVLPTPAQVVKALAGAPSYYLLETWSTLVTTLAGFAAAAVIGTLLAILIVEVKAVEKTAYTLIVALNSVPKVAVAPLFVIWLGTGPQPKIAIAFLIALFAVVIDTVLGMKSVPADMLDLAKTLHGRRWDVLWRVRLPCALPNMFAGLKVAVSLALVGAIVGEFVASSRGLGYVIMTAEGTFDTSQIFAAITMLGIVGVILFQIVEIAERKLIPWHSSQRRR
ncbi:MAG: ABC transporter permease [Acetobacteraceae bacterium]